MRTTLNLDPELLAEAAELTNITRKTDLVNAGLQALVSRESARRLAALGGTMPHLKVPPRRGWEDYLRIADQATPSQRKRFGMAEPLRSAAKQKARAKK